MKRFGQFGQLGAATILSFALSLGVASVAQATSVPVPASVSTSLTSGGTSLLLVDGHVTAVPTPLQHPIDTAQLLASWNAKLPALKAGLARGESLAVALQEAGLPAITGHAVSNSTAKGGVQPMSGPSCQDWTCGWEFDASSTYYIEWLVWAGVITGPGLVCALLGPPSLGAACAVAGALWSIISTFAYTPPRWSGRCLYMGIGLGWTKVKWESSC
jgi:hypothetical protein